MNHGTLLSEFKVPSVYCISDMHSLISLDCFFLDEKFGLSAVILSLLKQTFCVIWVGLLLWLVMDYDFRFSDKSWLMTRFAWANSSQSSLPWTHLWCGMPRCWTEGWRCHRWSGWRPECWRFCGGRCNRCSPARSEWVCWWASGSAAHPHLHARTTDMFYLFWLHLSQLELYF